MVFHGYPWFPSVIHGFPVISMVSHCYPWFPSDIHGFPWFSMVIHGFPVLSMVFHGYLDLTKTQTGPDIRTGSEAGNGPEVKQEVDRK